VGRLVPQHLPALEPVLQSASRLASAQLIRRVYRAACDGAGRKAYPKRSIAGQMAVCRSFISSASSRSVAICALRLANSPFNMSRSAAAGRSTASSATPAAAFACHSGRAADGSYDMPSIGGRRREPKANVRCTHIGARGADTPTPAQSLSPPSASQTARAVARSAAGR
jgi:hypothetical protein